MEVELFNIWKLVVFGTVGLNNHIDIDEGKYSGYGIGFYRKGTFSIGNRFGRKCITFGVDMSPFVHVDNKIKHILIIGEDPTQGLDRTTLTVENLTENNEKYCLRLHYNGANNYLVMLQKLLNLKQKTLKLYNSIITAKHFIKLFCK